MLRRVTSEEKARLAAFLNREPVLNLFMIGDLEDPGLTHPELAYWVQEQAGGRIAGVLMRYRYNWCLDPGPAPGRFRYRAAAAVLDRHPPEQVRGISGPPGWVDPLAAALTRHVPVRRYQQWLAALEAAPAPMPYTGRPRPARPDDVDAVCRLYAGAGEMARTRQQVVEAVAAGRTWLVEDGGQVVSVAGIGAETDRAAMIIGVFTPVPVRGRGYASTCVHALSTHLAQRGKLCCLFYHNPVAGRIYLRLGYRELGPWRTIRF